MGIGRVTDIKEIYDRQNELEGERDDYEYDHGKGSWKRDNPDDYEALEEIEKIESDCGADMLTLWRNGVDIVAKDHFKEHVMAYAVERLGLGDFNMRYFDEDTWVSDEENSYTEVEFEGRTYMVWSNF